MGEEAAPTLGAAQRATCSELPGRSPRFTCTGVEPSKRLQRSCAQFSVAARRLGLPLVS